VGHWRTTERVMLRETFVSRRSGYRKVVEGELEGQLEKEVLERWVLEDLESLRGEAQPLLEREA